MLFVWVDVGDEGSEGGAGDVIQLIVDFARSWWDAVLKEDCF